MCGEGKKAAAPLRRCESASELRPEACGGHHSRAHTRRRRARCLIAIAAQLKAAQAERDSRYCCAPCHLREGAASERDGPSVEESSSKRGARRGRQPASPSKEYKAVEQQARAAVQTKAGERRRPASRARAAATRAARAAEGRTASARRRALQREVARARRSREGGGGAARRRSRATRWPCARRRRAGARDDGGAATWSRLAEGAGRGGGSDRRARRPTPSGCQQHITHLLRRGTVGLALAAAVTRGEGEPRPRARKRRRSVLLLQLGLAR